MFALFAIYLPYFAVSSIDVEADSKNGASILAPVALSLGMNQMLSFESAFVPLNGANFSELYDNYSMAAAIGFLVFDIFLYVLLAWYADHVVPSEFGQMLPWYVKPCLLSVHTYTHTHTHTHTHIHSYKYICICMYACLGLCVCVNVCARVLIFIRVLAV